ncbi:DUF4880 domain-containing protein [Luteimonas sp. TWI1437]|uniref:FecR/PupR family sigma factor regulator n=1 Tax=unclassified Luteimonas TaxID=2629088 RepID=UPI0032081CCF
MKTESERIAQCAADFLARSCEETPDQRMEREAWLAADPRHARVYRYLQRLDEDARGLRDDPELRALLEQDDPDSP